MLYEGGGTMDEVARSYVVVGLEMLECSSNSYTAIYPNRVILLCGLRELQWTA